MKKYVPITIYLIGLILKGYSTVNFSELKNSIAPAFQEVYGNKWIVSEVAFELMSLLVLWYLWGDDGYSTKKRGWLIMGFVVLNLAIYLL